MQQYFAWISRLLWISSQVVKPDACVLLNERLPGRVAFPSSSEYTQQQLSYAFYSTVSPDCVVSPVLVSEVSTVMSIARENDFRFTVKSGGSSHGGCSNIGGDGFVLDLMGMDKVTLSEDSTRVFVQAGARWMKVYEELAALGLTTTGGRASTVGVGGFLLGGGISALSYKHGLANENIISYEVVLSNGTVVLASTQKHVSLFKALRFGGTNFGVVTRFELPIFLTQPMYAGVQVHDPARIYAILAKFPSFVHAADQSEDAAIFTIALVSAMKQTNVITLQAYYGSTLPDLASYFPSNSFSPLMDTMSEKSLLEYVQETSGSGLVKKGHTIWSTMSYIAKEADTDFAWDIFVRAQVLFAEHEVRQGFQWTFSIQPLTSRMHASSNDNLILVLLMVDWQNPEDEKFIIPTVRSWTDMAETEAQGRKLYHPYLFMNYAGSSQDVYGRSVDDKMLELLLYVQQLYDSDHTLARLLQGGFKLPVHIPDQGSLTPEL